MFRGKGRFGDLGEAAVQCLLVLLRILKLLIAVSNFGRKIDVRHLSYLIVLGNKRHETLLQFSSSLYLPGFISKCEINMTHFS